MTTVFEAKALEEYHEAAQYSEDRFGLGASFVAAVQSALAAISHDPERFQSVGNGVRVFRMKRFPYYLFFHHVPDREFVTVYALAHHGRHGDYWRDRLPNE